MMSKFNPALNQCPMTKVSETFELSNAQLDAVLKRARNESPVFFLPDIGFWAVTKYDDVKEVLSNKDVFSSEIAQEPLHSYSSEVIELFKKRNFCPKATLSNNEGEDHARIRKHTQVAFSPARNRQIESFIRELMNDAVEAIKADKKADLLEKIFYELPALVLFRLLGMPDEDVSKVKMWADSRLVLSFGKPSLEQQLISAGHLCDYWDYCVELVQKRLKSPQSDLPSDLISIRNNDDSILTIEDINNVVFGLLFAGHETTTNMSSNAMLTLLEHPQQWQEVVNDTKLIPNAIEECLRYRSSVVAWRRIAKQDVTISGTKITAGDRVLVFLPSANKDESHFEEGDEFNIKSKVARRHIAFGFGRHVCLGAPLARFELKIIIEELASQLPSLRLMEGKSHMPVDMAVQFRGPAQLWVEWD